jgi:hypothetical protein
MTQASVACARSAARTDGLHVHADELGADALGFVHAHVARNAARPCVVVHSDEPVPKGVASRSQPKVGLRPADLRAPAHA